VIEKTFKTLERVDLTARALAGMAMDFIDGLAADVRRTKAVAEMTRSLAREIGWPRMAKIIGEVIAERIG